MMRYVALEVMEGAYEVSCPDSLCDKKGVLDVSEIEGLVGPELVEKHKRFRLNTGKTLRDFWLTFMTAATTLTPSIVVLCRGGAGLEPDLVPQSWL